VLISSCFSTHPKEALVARSRKKSKVVKKKKK